MDKTIIMNKIKTSLLFCAIISLSCVCGGGSPQTNIPVVSSDVTIPRNDTIYSYGDSFTAGNNSSTADSAYAKMFATYYSCVLVNRGSGGTWAAAAWSSFKTDKENGINETATMMTGVNDYRSANHFHASYTLQYIGYLKSAITLQFLKSRISATSASVTLTGTWDSSTTNIVSSVSAKPLTSSTNNSTASYTFTDSTLVIGTYGSNGYSIASGFFDIEIDGVTKGRYFFGAFANDGYTPQTLVFRGLSMSSHTVVIRKIGNTKVCIDYFGHLKHISQCKPIIIGELPNWNKADYTNYIGTNFYTYINNQLCSITGDYYGYPVIVAPVNSYLNPETDIDTDNVHPTNKGHKSIYQSFLSVTQ